MLGTFYRGQPEVVSTSSRQRKEKRKATNTANFGTTLMNIGVAFKQIITQKRWCTTLTPRPSTAEYYHPITQTLLGACATSQQSTPHRRRCRRRSSYSCCNNCPPLSGAERRGWLSPQDKVGRYAPGPVRRVQAVLLLLQGMSDRGLEGWPQG